MSASEGYYGPDQFVAEVRACAAKIPGLGECAPWFDLVEGHLYMAMWYGAAGQAAAHGEFETADRLLQRAESAAADLLESIERARITVRRHETLSWVRGAKS